MKPSMFTTALLLAATAAAVPFAPETSISRRDGTPDPRSYAIVTALAPTSTTCDGAPFPAECVTGQQATEPLIESFAKYNIATPGEQAALLAWMAFESGDFKYAINHYPAPGTPGKGTRCMMSPDFVKQYAATIGVTGSDPATLLTNVNAAPGGEWGAASWFLTTQCTSAIRAGLQKGDQAGFSAFMTDCVITTLTDARIAGWKKAAQALGMTV